MLSSASIRYSVSRFRIRFLMGVALNGCRNVGLCPSTIGNFYKFAKAHTPEIFTICSEGYWLAGFGQVWTRPHPTRLPHVQSHFAISNRTRQWALSNTDAYYRLANVNRSSNRQ